MFYVLVGARMPSVLVEASFLTYEPEARALTRRNYRRAIANGIASGIASYLLAR
jgi:N-acetylmuramoyl-L-alanine amidase